MGITYVDGLPPREGEDPEIDALRKGAQLDLTDRDQQQDDRVGSEGDDAPGRPRVTPQSLGIGLVTPALTPVSLGGSSGE